jgi:hypothetical protein
MINLRSITRFIAVIHALLLISCTTTATTSEAVAVSDFFVIKTVWGGWEPYAWVSTDIYERLPNNDLRYIGTHNGGTGREGSIVDSTVTSFGCCARAISTDGRTVLFRRYPSRDSRAQQSEFGIFQYTLGDEVRLLYPQSELSGSSSRSEKPFPRDMLPLNYKLTGTPDDLTWALTTSGDLFPLALLGATQLHWAAFEGRTVDCAELVKNGADINAVTYWDFTPLNLAIIRDHQDTAIHLLSLGATTDTGKYPSLNRAVQLGRMNTVQSLLEHGVDVNATDRHGYTSLHMAVLAGSRIVDLDGYFDNAETEATIKNKDATTTLIQLLMEHGADPSIADNNGKTPLDRLDATRALVTLEYATSKGEDWETLNNARKAEAERILRRGMPKPDDSPH